MKTTSPRYIVLNLPRTLLGLMVLFVLAACGGSEQQTRVDWGERPRLEYSYPYHDQQAVSTRGPVVLRFSHALTDSAPESGVQWTRADGTPIPFTASVTEDGRSLTLTPDGILHPATEHHIGIGELNSEGRIVRLPEMPLRFTTRTAVEGPRDQRSLPGEFALARMIPDGGYEPVVDFTTFRLQFSQPISRTTLRYGDTLVLEDAAGEQVPARIFSQHGYVTIDPHEALQAGVDYTLRGTSDLRSIYGEALTAFENTVRVRSIGESEILALDAPDSDAGAVVSPLTGMPINAVPVRGRLLGDESVSQQQGDIFAELPYLPDFPSVTPMRVPRGSLLSGSAVAVNIGGEVPAGFDSGDVEVRFISDAMGFMIENPYTGPADVESPRHVRLFMDVALTAEEPQANGALSQDLLHVELAGTAFVEEGELVINAIGVVEPRVLGLEQAWGVLSFRLASYRDQTDAPAPTEDTLSPMLQSWVPGEFEASARPGDPVVLNFSEAMDPASVEGGVILRRDGAEVDYDWRLDGGTLVLYPEGGLQFGGDYTIDITSLLTDTAGNPVMDEVLAFRLPEYRQDNLRAPVALTTFPGYPCAKQDMNLSGSADEHQGRCEGGRSGDDRLPIETLPAQRPISVQFSQTMDLDSMVLGTECGTGTVRVERVGADGQCEAVVLGRLERQARGLRFTPDALWENDVLYRYVLASTQQGGDGVCGTQALCAEYGFPLQTALLHGRGAAEGGPHMVNYFRGAPISGDVPQYLRNLPTSDVNANYQIEQGEANPDPDPTRPGYFQVPDNAAELRVSDTSGLLLNANVGCGFNGGGYNPSPQECNDDVFLYVTGGLTANVGEFDTQENAVRVAIRPTVLVTSSIDVHAVILALLVPVQEIITTGPQIMRLRYEEDEQGNRTRPISGWLYESPEGPRLRATLQLYLDAPNLVPRLGLIELSHDLYSTPLTLDVDGPVEILPDGRMTIQVSNVGGPADINADINLIGLDLAGMTLQIPEGGLNLTFLAAPVQE